MYLVTFSNRIYGYWRDMIIQRFWPRYDFSIFDRKTVDFRFREIYIRKSYHKFSGKRQFNGNLMMMSLASTLLILRFRKK